MPEDAGFCRGCGTIVRGPKVRGLVPAGGRTNYPPPMRHRGIVTRPATEDEPAPPPPGTPASASAAVPPPLPPAGAAAPSPPRLAPGGPYGYRATGYGGPGGGPPGDTFVASGSGRGLFTRPTGCEVLVGAFTLAVLVSLFLPWYRWRASDVVGDTLTIQQTSALGAGAGGWRWVAVAISVSILLYLAVRLASRGEAPALPVRPTVVLATLAVANLALSVVAFFALPNAGFSLSVAGVEVGMAQSWGAFVGMIAAVLAATAGLLNRPGRTVIRS